MARRECEEGTYGMLKKQWVWKRMNGHMNLELKIIREIRMWGLGLGKCRVCDLGNQTGIFIGKP